MGSGRVFLIHGWKGRPDNHWFPWCMHELRARGFEVAVPSMPNPAHPEVSEWLSFLRTYVGRPGLHTFFVGHSLGCITIIRYLAELPEEREVGGCVFVAGFSGNIPLPDIAPFYSLPVNFDAAKAHGGRFVCIFSDNDSQVPLERSLTFAKQLGAKIILEKGKGHFTEHDGVTALPSLLTALSGWSKTSA